jgi:hypothetical protein
VNDQQRSRVDAARLREHLEERRIEAARNPSSARRITRVKVRLVENYLKEAQMGPFKVLSDEAAERGGGGQAPGPLQYLVAAVGF